MRSRIPAKPDATTIDVLKDNAEVLGYCDGWKVALIIHDGKIVGFNELEKPLMKFREKTKK